MATSISNHADRYVFANDDGTFTVWKNITYDGGNVVGPGYIGRVIHRNNGNRLTEGFVSPSVSANDPRIQGLGFPAWHHYRQNPNEPDIWNKGWEMKGNMDAAAFGGEFGISSSEILVAPYKDDGGTIRASFQSNFVDVFSVREGKRIMTVRFDYLVNDSNLRLWITYTQFPDGLDAGPKPFIKEPKAVCGVAPNQTDRYPARILDVLHSSGSLLRSIDLKNDPKLQDPTRGTVQVGFGGRARMRFFDEAKATYFNIVGRASTNLVYDANNRPINYGSRMNWEGANYGLDKWASLANARAEFDSSVCAAYCKQGGAGEPGLTRQWEVAKRGGEPQTSVMFHAWEGGSGLPDCLCCAKAFVPGEKWTLFFSMSRNEGWIL